MIKDKNTITLPAPIINKTASKTTTIEEVSGNAFVDMYQAVKRAILTIREDPDDDASAPFFKTIEMDNGQFDRLVRSENMEKETAFPAVFIHFVNIRYLVQQQRVGEGRATMRVRFILNRLNSTDENVECEHFLIFQRINVAIQDAKNKEDALNERCNLIYFDTPITTNMLQAYWIDYEVWFRETAAFKYRNWVERYLVIAPFTNHSDAPERDTESHGDHHDLTYEDVSELVGLNPDIKSPS